jgi:deoxyhypusine synthase
VVYLDSTIAMPILTSYALGKHRPRKLKRLYDRRAEIMTRLSQEYALALRKKQRSSPKH